VDDRILRLAAARLALEGAGDFAFAGNSGAVEGAADDERRAAALAHSALDVLAVAASEDARMARLHGVWRPWLERRAGIAAPRDGGDAPLLARLEDRLALIVAEMEQAREAGDEARAEALHARYIELGTTYAGRLVRAGAG
jgi:glyoxylase-like metal-dependent hydrolase (beta-lactamase superfamily II)